MAGHSIDGLRGGSFLLELLYFAGWQVRVRDGHVSRIHATRAGVELEASGATLAEAAGTVFARAMRSGDRRDRDEEE